MHANPQPRGPQTPSIFISYRRADTEGHAGRLSDNLKEHFGDRARVFMDFEAIPAGEDFVKVINDAVGSSQALIAVIGRQWLSITDAKTGKRRLDDERDHVRAEIASALRRGVRVFPVLVQGATMPGEDELPDDLKPLSSRNALEISGSRWNFDVQTLIKALEQALPKEDRKSRRLASSPAGLALAAVAVAVVSAASFLAWQKGCRPAAGNANANTGAASNVAAPSPGVNPTPVETPETEAERRVWSQVVADAWPSVVDVIRNPGPDETTSAGFLVSAEGHVLTVDYVINPAGGGENGRARFSVRTWDGKIVRATLVDVSRNLGLALLKTDAAGPRPIKLADLVPASGTKVRVIKSLAEGSNSTAAGSVRGVAPQQERALEVDTPRTARGIGGGPVLNNVGEAVGVSYSFAPPSNRICIRADIARNYLKSKQVPL